MPDPSLPAPLKLLTVIVLYGTSLKESAALNSLLAESEAIEWLPERGRLLVFDNTPGGQDIAGLPDNVVYHAAGRNEGIAAAYNYALEMAEREGAKWLLTLDEDTRMPPGFFARLRELAVEKEPDIRIAAIAPQLSQGDIILSPYRVLPWGIRYLPRGFEGIAAGEIHGLNSGSLFRVRALREIGGFDSRFWLDYQDYATFRALYRNGKSVWVAGGLQLEHELSLISERQSMSEERFRNFLRAETAFSDLSGNWISGPALTARLAGRLWRQHRRGADPLMRRLTREALWRRIGYSRKARLREWDSATRQRAIDLSQEGQRRRLRISVCIATYGGERYIAQQLSSILCQLSEEDEVIVVDDGSVDHTCDVVEAMGDKRIRLHRHESNVGVLRTFEHAILEARGEVIFLADQDDLWAPDKVNSVLRAFAKNPEAEVVVSDASLIDEQDKVIGASYYAVRGSFRPGVLSNLFRCKFLGCTMAFRRRLCGRILPFPANADILHDLWIGVANSISGGKTLYINRPLVLYRRHGNNATGVSRLSFARRIRIRWDLCLSLVRRWAQLHGSR